MCKASANSFQLLKAAIVAFTPSSLDYPDILACVHFSGAKAVTHQHQHPLNQGAFYQIENCDDWNSSWMPRSGDNLPTHLSCYATVGQRDLTPPPTPDTRFSVAKRLLFTHSRGLEWR